MIFIARPVLLAPVWGFCAFGYRLSAGTAVADAWRVINWRSFLSMAFFSCAVGSVYVLNQMADLKVDASNKGFALLVHGHISRATAWTSAALLALTSIAASYIIRPGFALFALSALLLGVVYSFKPAYLSGRPFADFLANAAGYGVIAFGAGWSLGGRTIMSGAFVLAAAPYFFLMCSGSICSTLPDYEGDYREGKRTTAVAIGIARAHRLSLVFLVIAAAASVYARDWPAFLAGAIALMVNVAYAIKRSEALMEASYKAGGAALMAIAAIVYPAVIVPSLLTIVLTRLYFQYRHGVRYPTLVPLSHGKK